MGNSLNPAARLRMQLRQERERRGWSQVALANALATRYHVPFYAQTIAKIENGERTVRADELGAFADAFGMTTDALLGRSSSGTDVLWAASKLSSNAQKMVSEVMTLQDRLFNDTQDLCVYAERENQRPVADQLVDHARRAQLALQGAADALAKLAGEFPLPGRGG